MIGVCIVGGTGYGAGELLRLLAIHPEATVCQVVSQSQAGKALSNAHPQLDGLFQLTFADRLDVALLQNFNHRVVFAALPHGASGELISQLSDFIESGGIVIDLSGDFRLQDQSAHQKHYAESAFLPEVRNRAVYGLPEFFREQIRNATVIANPGCYATTAALAAAPLLRAGLEVEHIAFDAKSGTSGAGRGIKDIFHHPRRSASMTAYSVLTHRHEPEILQTLEKVSSATPSISFVPHLLPISRGIFVTAHVILKQEIAADEVENLFQAAYANETFIRLRKGMPEIADVVGSNFCDIGVSTRGRVVVVAAVLDNLVKGMAGQAIQNLNIISGLEETTGLLNAGLGLV